MYVWGRKKFQKAAGGRDEEIRGSLEKCAEVLRRCGSSAEEQLGYHFESGGGKGGLIVIVGSGL